MSQKGGRCGVPGTKLILNPPSDISLIYRTDITTKQRVSQRHVPIGVAAMLMAWEEGRSKNILLRDLGGAVSSCRIIVDRDS